MGSCLEGRSSLTITNFCSAYIVPDSTSPNVINVTVLRFSYRNKQIPQLNIGSNVR